MYDSDQNIHIEGLLACLPYVQFVDLLPAFPLSSSTLEMIRTGTLLPSLQHFSFTPFNSDSVIKMFALQYCL